MMSVCDIFCLPSRNEGMGKVLVEAMAVGKPIIASDIGGIPELVVPGENGILVPVGETAGWEEAIARLCRDPGERRRMGDAGVQTAPHYSAEEMVKKIDLLYEEALNQENIACKSGGGR